MQVLLPILSVIHVLGAVIWAGWAFSFVGFVAPGVDASGQAGTSVMQRIMAGPILRVLQIVPVLVVLSGLILYWFYSGRFSFGYLTTFGGIALTIGALAGIAAFAEGMFVTGPTAGKLEKLGAELAASQGPPPPEKLQAVQALRARLKSASTRGALFLLVAVVGMSIGGA